MAEELNSIETAVRMSHRHLMAALGLDAVRKDELRQAGQSRAWRNGFFAVLGLQPVLALALDGSANAAALMAAGSVTIGATAMLASLLWYDR
ncbi:hypothetical protein SRABI118_02845 [Massilia sp. Bi118]|uniref:hypothetical protein n=1 Tax=Massilia sp. Bi118 TaxID=2822346 RepID=UPI001D7AAEDF|nr:hypothetical protein [Massilia sp. Bi118]CAH0245969.1 hypothetical protein SRABI118_02845 [Massilia sp. Bi118]